MTTLEHICTLVENEFSAVNTQIIDCLSSRVPLIQEMGHYLVQSGGKRIRPLLVLLTAKACGYSGDQHITLATIIEFIHSATLLHDDVIDGSAQRRNRPTANQVWGNPASILVGDFLYSRAFELIVSLQTPRLLEILASATNMIVEGEVIQLTNRHNPDLEEAIYHHIVQCKTAKLFEAGAQLGAHLAKQSASIEQSCADYGFHLGYAFQLVDDVLDYRADTALMGKNLGDDLAEGKVTLPLLYTLQSCTADEAQVIRQAIKVGSLTDLPLIQQAIKHSGAIEHTLALAQAQADKALACLEALPETPYRQALQALAKFSIHRAA